MMAASPNYDRVASVLVAIALRLVDQNERSQQREEEGEDAC